MTVKLDPPHDRAAYRGFGAIQAAHVLPLGLATAEGSMVGVQLDLETRQSKDPKRPARVGASEDTTDAHHHHPRSGSAPPV